jgi:hypothetical protein
MALFPGTPKLESRNCPETVPVGVPKLSRNCPGWSPGTLGAHNSGLQSPIKARSEPKL